MESMSCSEQNTIRNFVRKSLTKSRFICFFFLQRLFFPSSSDSDVGFKVLSVTTGPITFKDSFCFLPFSLATFPKAFGLVEVKRGFFLTFLTPVKIKSMKVPCHRATCLIPMECIMKNEANLSSGTKNKLNAT